VYPAFSLLLQHSIATTTTATATNTNATSPSPHSSQTSTVVTLQPQAQQEMIGKQLANSHNEPYVHLIVIQGDVRIDIVSLHFIFISSFFFQNFSDQKQKTLSLLKENIALVPPTQQWLVVVVFTNTCTTKLKSRAQKALDKIKSESPKKDKYV